MKIDWSTILYNLISSLVFGILVVAWGTSRAWLTRRLPSFSLPSFIIVITAWCFLYGLVLHSMTKLDSNILIIVSTICCFGLILIGLIWHECGNLKQVGVVHADKRVADGLSYDKALALSKNRLRFLGLGAAKLTKSPEFEQAVLRCTHEGPVDLLLLKPTDSLLEKAAQRAKRDRDDYKRAVRNSLRVVRDMRNIRGVNIRARFYDELPIFRLMFIDNTICLVSYYVLGEGDGSQLPQMHLISNPMRRRTVDSFYHAFNAHYDRIWEHSEEWDFVKYV